jgi:hypothetical protein
VYTKVPTCCATFWFAAYTARGEELLTPNQGAGGLTLQGVHYMPNNGWIAYTQEGATGGPRQVWTRSPTGTKQQLTVFANTSVLESVGPNGEVVFGSGTGRYLVRSVIGASPRRINSRLGTAYLEAPDMFVAIGRVLFKATP